MGKGRIPTDNEKEGLVDMVKWEIDKHRNGRLQRLSTNKELGDLLGVDKHTIWKYLRKKIIDDQLECREGILEKQGGIKVTEMGRGIHKLTYQERSKNGKRAGKKSGEMAKENGTGIFALTHDQRVENGKKAGKMHKENGTGIFGKDPETGDSYQSKGIKKSKERGAGLFGLTHDQRVENGIKSTEFLRKSSYYIENRFYTSSQQEGAVALLLEKYLNGYKINDGVNFQVKDKGINNGGIDFLVDKEFLEWHPIHLYSDRNYKGEHARGDIPSDRIESYKKTKGKLSEKNKKRFDERYAKVLGAWYLNDRQETINNSEYAGLNVSLVKNTQELYDFLKRYSSNLPSYDDFRREFNQHVKYVKTFKIDNNKEKAA